MRLIDLCAILIVVGFSFIFTLKETKYVNNQLLFIVSFSFFFFFLKNIVSTFTIIRRLILEP